MFQWVTKKIPAKARDVWHLTHFARGNYTTKFASQDHLDINSRGASDTINCKDQTVSGQSLSFSCFKARAAVFIYLLHEDVVKFMLTVLYFGNTKSEVKVTLKKFCLVFTVLVIAQEQKNHVGEILVICSPTKSGAPLNGRKCMYSVGNSTYYRSRFCCIGTAASLGMWEISWQTKTMSMHFSKHLLEPNIFAMKY